MMATNDKTLTMLKQQYSSLQVRENAIPRLKVIGLSEFLAMELPPRELILSPWLPEAGLCMIHAYRGIGKTHVALGIAYAVAISGEFLGWKAGKPRGVLYIDGEMPAVVLQERLAHIAAMNGDASHASRLRIITPDFQEMGMPDLATSEGQAIIEQYIDDSVDLIVLDNLSCLVRSGKENDSSDWMPMQEWVLKLRAQGKAVLMIHHSGKGKQQRGSSKREDVLDTVISLERPEDYEANQGARFTVKYEKNRGFFGDDARSFEAHLCADSNGKASWKTQGIEESTKEKVITLYNDGMSQAKIAEELDIHKSNVSRYITAGRREGLIKEVYQGE